MPLCVDLDRTLLRTDMLWESALQLWRRPLAAARAVASLIRGGKAAFKKAVAEAVTFDPAALPYRDDVLEFVRLEHAAGRTVLLATAAHDIVARRIAAHLGFFRDVLATDAAGNLSGTRKRDALEAAYGRGGFDYVGDGWKDMPVYASARQALLVAPSPALLKKASSSANVSRVFPGTPGELAVIARMLRLHQWVKNVLVAVPLVAAHRIADLQAWADAALAFLAFGLVASATYIVNDLLDLHADRLHAHKRHRPLASGEVTIPFALACVPALGALGFGVAAATLPAAFVGYLALYVALTVAYSTVMKRRLLVDVLTLAMLYTLRVLAGGAAVGVAVSDWLAMFSMFVFLSLAFLKRAIELGATPASQRSRLAGRGYALVDLDTVRTIGVAAGLLSVLVLALYINSSDVNQLYRAPGVLWLICPLLVYWISRLWFLAARGEIHHDPLVSTLLDWRSYVVAALALAVIAAATFGLAPPFALW